MMTNDDYKNRRIKHRSTGQEGKISFWIADLNNRAHFIVVYDTNVIDILSKENVEHAFHILEKEAEVVYVDFPARRAGRVVAGEVA